METLIIGQGYNLKKNTSVAEELIKQFKSKRYTSFTCLVAFASRGGISPLTPYIREAKANGMQIKIILGVDQKGTSKEALEEVLSWDVDAKIYHTDSVNIFHPKIYLFENEDIFTLIVGSNNLTEMGLVNNIECSLLIKDIVSNQVHNDFYVYWKKILDGSEEALIDITQKNIDDLCYDEIVPSDEQRAKKYDDGSDKKLVEKKKRCSFVKGRLQKLPQGFSISRRVKIAVNNSAKAAKKISKNKYKYQNILENVLIAEIGGGPRWKQVNFPVDIFEHFFGAHRGDNSYQIELQNVSEGGNSGDVEIRQAVSVKSRNYRFEINCQETQGPYPGVVNRPIGIFIKTDNSKFLYTVLLPEHCNYEKIKEYLYRESKNKDRELKRAIVHTEAMHALYPELID